MNAGLAHNAAEDHTRNCLKFAVEAGDALSRAKDGRADLA